MRKVKKRHIYDCIKISLSVAIVTALSGKRSNVTSILLFEVNSALK